MRGARLHSDDAGAGVVVRAGSDAVMLRNQIAMNAGADVSSRTPRPRRRSPPTSSVSVTPVTVRRQRMPPLTGPSSRAARAARRWRAVDDKSLEECAAEVRASVRGHVRRQNGERHGHEGARRRRPVVRLRWLRSPVRSEAAPFYTLHCRRWRSASSFAQYTLYLIFTPSIGWIHLVAECRAPGLTRSCPRVVELAKRVGSAIPRANLCCRPRLF